MFSASIIDDAGIPVLLVGDSASNNVLANGTGGKAAFSGPIRTLKCFQDNALLKATVSEPGEGAVLVVDGAGFLRRALMGDAKIAANYGWAGVTINGAVRDVAELRTIPLGSRRSAPTPANPPRLVRVS
jgi:regulator of ribonuclease activity A